MSMPKFSDLGKSARDLFSKGYNFGEYRVEAKTKTKEGVELTTTGFNIIDSGVLAGGMEFKYTWTNYGLTLTDQWMSDNFFVTELKHEDKLLKGLELDLDARWTMRPGSVDVLTSNKRTYTGHARAAYKNDYVHVDVDVNYPSHRPLSVTSALVLGFKGWIVGVEVPVDNRCTAKSVLSDSSVVAGYSKNDLAMHWALRNGRFLEGSVFHRVNDRLETGVQLEWSTGSRSTFFGFGAKYCPDKDTTVRVKLQSSNQIGLSYQYNIHEGVSLTLSALLATRREPTKSHKFGLALDISI